MITKSVFDSISEKKLLPQQLHVDDGCGVAIPVGYCAGSVAVVVAAAVVVGPGGGVVTKAVAESIDWRPQDSRRGRREGRGGAGSSSVRKGKTACQMGFDFHTFLSSFLNSVLREARS